VIFSENRYALFRIMLYWSLFTQKNGPGAGVTRWGHQIGHRAAAIGIRGQTIIFGGNECGLF
jgi:hypothetical protein